MVRNVEIILREEDLKHILKQHYSDVEDIQFSGKNPKVTLVMKTTHVISDPDKNIEPVSVTKHNITPEVVPKKTVVRTNEPKNVMSSNRRVMDL